MFQSPHILKEMIPLKLFYFLLLVFEPVMLFDPATEMPFTEVLGSSTKINPIWNSLKCADGQNNTEACAVECWTKNEQGEKCIGFLQRGTNCYLCKVLQTYEIDSGEGTEFTPEDKLYILQSLRNGPEVYISMDEYDLSTQTIKSRGVTGISSNITADDLISEGKVGQAIYFHSGGNIILNSSQPECFCNFDLCNGTLFLSLWIKLFGTTEKIRSIIRPLGVNNGLNVKIKENTYELEGVLKLKESRLIYRSISAIPSNWTFVVVTVNTSTGIAVYLNGIKDNFVNISAAKSYSNYQSACALVVMGIKSQTQVNPADSYLDEVKYFYRELTDVGESITDFNFNFI